MAQPGPAAKNRTMQIGRVQSIHRFPVKSMAGEQLECAQVELDGVIGDRAFAVRDELAGEIRGGRKLPALMMCSARYLEEPNAERPLRATVDFPDGTSLPPEPRDRDGASLKGVVESGWAGRVLRVGGLRLACTVATCRCSMVTQPQPELHKDTRVLRTIVREANQCVGIYARVLQPSRVACGNVVELE